MPVKGDRLTLMFSATFPQVRKNTGICSFTELVMFSLNSDKNKIERHFFKRLCFRNFAQF